jgi:IPT/TIG domain
MNHSLSYMTIINQTIYEGNITVNGTSQAQYSYITVPSVNNWVYYEYIHSSVYYWNYKDIVVRDMFPHSAIMSGGTTIHVSGAWFKDMPWHGVSPHCKFGDRIVRGSFDSTVRITCLAPPGKEIGQLLPMEISLNGVDFTDTGF